MLYNAEKRTGLAKCIYTCTRLYTYICTYICTYITCTYTSIVLSGAWCSLVYIYERVFSRRCTPNRTWRVGNLCRAPPTVQVTAAWCMLVYLSEKEKKNVCFLSYRCRIGKDGRFAIQWARGFWRPLRCIYVDFNRVSLTCSDQKHKKENWSSWRI